MKRSKIKVIIATGILVSTLFSSVVGASTLTGVDAIYKKAYDDTIVAVNSGKQKDINVARSSIDSLKQALPNSTYPSTFSSMLDKVQGPIYSDIVRGILSLKEKVDSGSYIDQASVNNLRTLCLGDLNDDSDDIPSRLYNSGWSQGIDELQQSIINRAHNLFKVASTEKTEESVNNARVVIDDLKTSVSKGIVDWAKSLEDNLNKIEINNGNQGDTGSNLVINGQPSVGVVAPGAVIKLPMSLEAGEVAMLIPDANSAYKNSSNYDGVDKDGRNIVFYNAKGGETTINAPKKGCAYTLYIFNKSNGDLKFKGVNYVRVNNGIEIKQEGNVLDFSTTSISDGVFGAYLVDPKLQLFPDIDPNFYTIWNYEVAIMVNSGMSAEDVAKEFYNAIIADYGSSSKFNVEDLKLNGSKITLPSNLKFSYHCAEDTNKVWK